MTPLTFFVEWSSGGALLHVEPAQLLRELMTTEVGSNISIDTDGYPTVVFSHVADGYVIEPIDPRLPDPPWLREIRMILSTQPEEN